MVNLPPPAISQTGWPWHQSDTVPVKKLAIYPKITIVTPTYQHGHYLEETMRSVLLQDYPNLDYVVIDGGSQDETVSLLERYENHLSAWVSERDNGHAHAVNKGFARSSGEIMAWLNAGDFYFPGALQRVAEIFQAFPDLEWLTTFQQGHFRETTGAYTYEMPGFSRSFFGAGGYLGFEPFALGFIQQESTFWRRSLWDRTGGRLDETLRMANDFDLWRRFFAHAKPALVNAPLGCFRFHDDQRSGNQTALYKQEAWQSLGRNGNTALSLGFRWFNKLRLHKLTDWRTALKPFFAEHVAFISQQPNGEWQREWRKLL